MSAWDKIKGFFGKKKLNVIHLNAEDFAVSDSDSEQVRKLKEINNALSNEAQYLKGRLLKLKSQESEQRQGEQEQKEEQEKIGELNKQYEELRKDSDKPVSMQLFFQLIKKRKDKKNPIILTTFDGKKSLGQAQDILFYPDGNIGVSDGKKVIWASKNLEDVFYWVSGLNNYIKKGIIPLCVDENGKYTPNLMEQEVPEWVRLSNNKFTVQRFNRKKVYEQIQEKDEQLQEVSKELEATEETVSEQQKEIHEKERETALHQGRADKYQSELSIALDKINEIEKAQGVIVRENLALNNLKEVYENTVERMERLVDKWASKVEKEGGSSTRDKAYEDLKQIISFAKNNLGNQTINMPEKEEPSLVETHGPPRKP
jgi:ribosomal protein S20